MNMEDKFREDLPLHAVGALTPQEAAEMEAHLSSCVDCRQEFASLANASAQIGLAIGTAEVPARVRARLMRDIGHPQSREIKARKKQKTSIWPVWAWVPALAAVLLAVLSINLWQHSQRLEEQNRDLAARLKDGSRAMALNRALLETLTSAEAFHVTLSATGKPAAPQAKAIYSLKNATLVLTASNLAPLPASKAYEFWLLPADGTAPIPAGVFKPQANGNAILIMSSSAPNAKPKAFAVTIEPESGSTSPTMPIVLVGSV